jgi:hypothetical protein
MWCPDLQSPAATRGAKRFGTLRASFVYDVRALSTSADTVLRDWTLAKAWLAREPGGRNI